MKFIPFFLDPLWLTFRCTLYIGGGSKSSQQSSTSSSSTVYDNRVALADDAAYATGGGVVDRSANDNRTFDDHSTFSIQADQTDNSVSNSGNTSIDSRDFSDNSSFAIDASQVDSSQTSGSYNTSTTNTDARNFSDNSSFAIDASQHDSSTNTTTTNISSSDPETLKELARGAFSAAQLATNKGSEMLSTVLSYGDTITERAMGGVAADREFASKLAASMVESSKSADQQTTEKILKTGAMLAGGALLTFAVVKIFARKAA